MKMQKNILLIIIDCLRADFVYESEKANIPNLRSLMNYGYSFLNTISSTSATTTSFASLLTGLYPFENGVRSHWGYSLNNNIITFPEIVRKNGYNTYAEVTGPLFKEIGIKMGFDEYNFRDVKKTIHTKWGDVLIEKFKNYYKEPWFVLLHIWALHKPRIILDDFNQKEFGNTRYARALASIDNFLGNLFQSIKDNTIIILTGDHGEQIAKSRFEDLSKTITVEIFRKLRKYNIIKAHTAKVLRNIHIGHGHIISDILVKIPLIFYNEDIIQKGESSYQVRLIDIFPTIIDLVDIKSDINVTGKSLIEMMKRISKKHRDAYMEATSSMFVSKDDWLAGIRVDNRYKFVYSPLRKDFGEELYDLQNDPEEKQNIAKENTEIVKLLKKKIKKLKINRFTGKKIEIDKDAEEKIFKRLRSLGYID